MRSALLAIAALAALAAASPAAEYRDRNVDGRRYMGTVANNDFGTYRNVEIEFRGDRATVFLPRGRLLLVLDDEHIADPAFITAYDPRRGIRWEMAVRGLDREPPPR